MIEVRVIGEMDNSQDHTFESANRVYDTDGLAPTLNCCGGGGLQPKIVAMRGRDPENPTSRKPQTPERPFEQMLEINQENIANALTTVQKDNMVLVRQATAKGYIEMELGGVADLSYPDSKVRRGRVQEGGMVCPTLLAGDSDICRIEPSLVGGLGEKNSNGGTQYYQHDRVYDAESIAMAHQAQLAGGSYKYMVEEKMQYRIRKLTPKECFRLMGVKDEDYEKLTVSNSQKYKQAGNSIVVDVLEAIFENMFINECKPKSLF